MKRKVLGVILSMTMILSAAPYTADVVSADTNLPFIDVNKNFWYFDYIYDVYEKGMMNGISDTLFNPEGFLTREDFVTVLWRMEDSPKTDFENNFTDVKSDAYYANAIDWAFENGVVEGYSEEYFGVNRNITREEIATILYRYICNKNSCPEETTILDNYDDQNKISQFALDAMKWCVFEGILEGEKDTILNPQGDSSRAVCATIFSRISDKSYYTHTWVDITETVPVYEKKYLTICNGCGGDFTGCHDVHAKEQMLAGNTACGRCHTEYRKVQTGTKTVVTGQKCSGCGLTK